jgi:hypothetical protein
MQLNSRTKTLLAVAGILLLIYLVTRSFTANNNKEVTTTKTVTTHEEETILPENMDQLEGFNGQESPIIARDPVAEELANNPQNKALPLPREDMIQYFPQRDYAPPESSWLSNKFNSRNKAKRGFKKSSYIGAMRGNLGPSEWESYFDHNNDVVGGSQSGENDRFLPVDETNNGFAVFKSRGRATCGSNQNCDPEDLFDVDKYLPQEVNDDWFEVQPEPISVKNRHLINITKPIGINTIGSSLKNASYDIRAQPACPKFVVSPWLQSSVEPDLNVKPMF